MAAKAKVSQIGAALYWVRRKQRYWRLRAVDPWHNRRCGPERFLVLRHHFKPHFYQHFLDWVAREFPEQRRLFELNLVPCRVTRWDEYRLHLPWLQDPVQHWSSEVYTHALRLQEKCDERGIPVINRVDRLTNATKSKAAAVLNGAGLRTARMIRVTDFAAFRENFLGLRLPLFVREDWGHG